MDTGISEAFESFMTNRAVLEQAILSSTKASWGGSGYSVELFPDGTYRVLWDNQIGNLYHSRGIIVAIPPLASDEYSQEDENGEHDAGAISDPFFDNAKAALREAYEQYEQCRL